MSSFKKAWPALIIAALLLTATGTAGLASQTTPGRPAFRLGNEVLFDRYLDLLEGRRVGLITNQSGVNSQGRSTIDVFAADPRIQLVALYGPEHGIDGQALAGVWVESYTHPTLHIPVYSLYGATRMPTEAMLREVDVLVYDVQDIGARTYTYISTLNYAMKAAAQHKKPVVVLDRPNPLGGETVEAPVLEDRFRTFVGVDKLPMAHGMTVGELARFFNRDIGADLTVVPMEGYTRDMIWHDTGLPWVQTSPNIPCIDSVFGYMATGLGEGTGIYQSFQFKWIGGRGIDGVRFAELLNAAGLPGVLYVPETVGSAGGVRLVISDYRTFNPARSGLWALAFAKQLTDFKVPKSGTTQASIVMFDKIMGTDRVGIWLEQRMPPRAMELLWAAELAAFRQQRQQYLIYGLAHQPGQVTIYVNRVPIFFDSEPYINRDNRTMVPVRAIAESLGAEVSWDPSAQVVTLVTQHTTLTLTIGSNVVLVNGARYAMDTVAVIQSNRTMVPLRFVSQLLGADVEWDAVSRTVTVVHR